MNGLTTAEVCEALSVDVERLLLLVKYGHLRISEESVEEYIALGLPSLVVTS